MFTEILCEHKRLSSHRMLRYVIVVICATATFLCAGFGAHAAFVAEGMQKTQGGCCESKPTDNLKGRTYGA